MGGRLRPESVAGINRNGWPASTGIGGRHQPEYALIILSVLAFAGIVMFKNFRRFQKRKEELQMKEYEFIDKLLAEGDKESDQSFQIGGIIEDVTQENELGINDV